MGGILGEGWLLRLVLDRFLEACECRGFGGPVSVGFGGCGLVSVIWRLGVVSEAAWLRTWSVGEGFHALHWNMLSWFVFCPTVLRGFLFGREVRVVSGGVILWMKRSDVGRGIGGWVCGLVTTRCLAFFGGLCVRARRWRVVLELGMGKGVRSFAGCCCM